jgi:hypothetical protein
MVTPGDEGHVEPLLKQAGADDAPDCPGAMHHETHAALCHGDGAKLSL